MAEQKLIISATTPDGLDASKTISNINPQADNAKLAQLGQMLNNMTDNTYGKTDRVVTYNCDAESGGAGKTQATITLTTESIDLASLKTALKSNIRVKDIGDISYNGDGQLYAFVSEYPTDGRNFLGVSAVTGSSGSYGFNFFSGADTFVDQITAPITITIRADETDNYTAAEATFTVTV